MSTPPPGPPYGPPYRPPYGPPPALYPPPRSSRVNSTMVLGACLALGVVLLVVSTPFVLKSATRPPGTNIEREIYPGSTDDPLVVDEGEGFTIRNFTYSAGWSLNLGATAAESSILNLEVTNHRDEPAATLVLVVALETRDGTFRASVDCMPNATLESGQSQFMTCTPVRRDVSDYGRISVHDSSFFED